MESKFTLKDALTMHDLIIRLHGETKPINEHVDPLCIELEWNKLDQMLIKMINSFKDQLVDKDAIEYLLNKKINSFEKVYNSEGVLTAINVTPIQSVEYINLSFIVSPSGTEFN